MLNIIQNTIGAIRRVGESVVRVGLKMWLPFTKAEPLGEDLVVNGDFATNSDWSIIDQQNTSSSGWGINNGSANYDGSGSQYNRIYQVLNTVVGKTYKMTFTLSGLSSSGVNFGFGSSSASFVNPQITYNANGTYTRYMVADRTDHSIIIQNNSATQTFSIDNISVEEYAQETPDISGNDNNAILKTGKALVFHANDSLETSFPTSKDIKTIAFWIYPTASNTNETLFWLGGSSFASKYVLLNHLTLTSSPYAQTDFDVYVDGVFAGATFGGQSVTLVQDQWQRVVLKSSTAINVTSDTFNVAGGAAAGGQFKMSDLQIYGAEFTTNDIAYDYTNPQKLVTDNASSSVTLNDLHAWWHMSEGDGTIAFDSAPLIGSEVVTDNTFNDTNEWIKENGWVVSGGLATRTDVDSYTALQQNCLVSGETYTVTIVVDSVTSGNIFGVRLGTNYILQGGLSVGTHTATGTANGSVLSIMGNPDFAGSISSISIKEVFNIDGETYDGSSLGATYDDAQERIPQLGMMNWSKGSNVLTYSNDFSNSHWSVNGVNIDSGYIAPDGTATAYKVSQNGIGILFDANVSPNIGVTRSIWAKTVSGTGTVHLTSYSGNTNSIFTITNEWQRFSATSGSLAAGNFYAVDFRGSSTLTEVILWGAQEEVNVGDSLSAFRRTNGTALTDATLISSATDSQKDILGNAVRVKGSGFNLDGTGLGEVPHTTDFDFGTGDFSVSAWVKYGFVDKGSGLNVIFSNGLASASGSNNGFHLFSQADGIYFRMSNGTIFETKNIISNPTTNNWYHIAITRSGTDLNTYIDNVGTSHTISSIDVDTSFPLKIGVDRRSDRHYSYKIDDVILYDTELSSDEIEQNYKATKSGHNN